MSAPEDALAWQMSVVGIKFEREVQVVPSRRWRADFRLLGYPILVEVDGGSWIGGRHTSGKGFENDLDKSNTAQLAGYLYLRVTPRMVDEGRALVLIEDAILRYRQRVDGREPMRTA